MNPVSPAKPEAVPQAVWNSTGLLVLGRLWAALSGFGCLACLTRADLPWSALPALEFGQLTYYLALYVLLDCLVDFGTAQATLQLGAGDANLLAASIRAGRRLRAATALAGWALVSIGAALAGESDLGWIVLASLTPLTRAAELSTALYQSEIRWGMPVLVRSLLASVRLLLFVLLAHSGVDHFGPYLAGFALPGGLANLVLYLLLRRRLPARAGEQHKLPWRALFVTALPLALVGVAQQAYFYADNFILRSMQGDEELGRYNAAVKVLSLLIMVSSFATSSALPWLARRSAEARLGAATGRLLHVMLPLACLLLGLLWPLCPWLLGALFGPAFEAAGASLQWLLLAAATIYAGAPLLTALVAAKRSKDVLWVVLGGLCFNLICNLVMIPVMGTPGAALATFGTEVWVAVGAYCALFRARMQPELSPMLLLCPLLFWLASSLVTALCNAVQGRF